MNQLAMASFTNQTIDALLRLDSNPFDHFLDLKTTHQKHLDAENDVQMSNVIESVSFMGDSFQIDSSDLEKSISVVKKNNFKQLNLSKSLTIKNCSLSLLTYTNSIFSTEIHGSVEAESVSCNKWQRELKHWGLPAEIVRKYSEKGISSMFQWQVECLACKRVLDDGANLVYSAPTSAGKTLVAEILSIKTVLERRKKVIMILPFISVVREKMFYFQDIFNSMGVRVEGFMGSHAPPGGFQSVHIAICTIEKANSLINRLLEDGTISQLGAIIVDELHLLGDQNRGYILELLLTKIRYVCKKFENIDIQIIGMSATLPNLSVLSKWLDAALYVTEFRPIPLDEYCLIDKHIYNSKMEFVREIQNTEELSDENGKLLHLCIETIKDGCSILIFCPTKNWCEILAQQLANSFWKLGKSNSEHGLLLRKQLDSSSISETLEQLKNCPVGLDRILQSAISFGVAFHHAGLTLDERDIVEGAFKKNIIRVLVATSTLSSGVNLPARRVIIRSPIFHSQPINILTYKQMIGRAGRMGRDTAGESILFCTANERSVAQELMSETLEPISSCLFSGDRLSRAILEAIASKIVCNEADVESFIKSTLLLYQEVDQSKTLKELMSATLPCLTSFELIRQQVDESGDTNYVATALGRACLSSSMAPNDGLSLFSELQKARQCLVLETELHLIYLVTPYSVSSMWGEVDWLHFFDLWESLSTAMKRVGELVGVHESFIFRCMRGTTKSNNIDFAKKIHIHKRFYTALALQDLVNEVSLNEVAQKFRCSRGMLQSLQQSSATFAGMVTAFCHELGWSNLEVLVSQFQDRLHFGIQRELLDLMRLPSLNGLRARALHNAGIETLCMLASESLCNVENALHSALPFQSEKLRDGEDGSEVERRNKMKSIWVTGLCGLTAAEAASMLIEDARKYLQLEMGVSEVVWKNDSLKKEISSRQPSVDIQNVTNGNNLVNGLSEINITNLTDNNMQTDEIPSNKAANNESKLYKIIEKDISANFHRSHDIEDDIEKVNTDESVEIMRESRRSIPIVEFSSLIQTNKHSTPTQAATFIDNVKNVCRNSGDWSPIENITNLLCKSKDSITVTEKNYCFNDNILNGSLKSNTSLVECSGSPSLFGDSLNLDTQACELLESAQKNKSVHKEDTIHSLDDAFTSTFVEIKVESEVHTKPSLNILETINKSEELIASSQESSFRDTKHFNSTTFKSIRSRISQRGNITLKRKLQSDLEEIENTPILEDSPSKICKIETSSENKLVAKISVDVTKENQLKDTQSKVVFIPKIGFRLKQKIENKNDFLSLKMISITESNWKCYDNAVSRISKSKKLSLSLAVCHLSDAKPKIGIQVLKNSKDNKVREVGVRTNCQYGNMFMEGLSIYLGEDPCYYFAIQTYSTRNLECFLEFLLKIFSDKDREVIMYSSKSNYLNLKYCCNVKCIKCILKDPCILEWIFGPEESVRTISEMVSIYCQYDIKSAFDMKSKSNDITSLSAGNVGASINAWATWQVFVAQIEKNAKSCEIFPDVIATEMQIVKILAESEFHGVGIDKDEVQNMLTDVKQAQRELEACAFSMVGHCFNFNSSKDVAKSLGIYKGKKISTAKRTLEMFENPLAKVIIYWRKLNTILSKCFFPITAKAISNKRIYGTYIMHTSTGRISMYEPNLQNVPRSFRIPNCFLPKMTESQNNDGAASDCSREFVCRNIFPASEGYSLVSADYCQLELRILAHLSEDETLQRIMKSECDIFKAIASSWQRISEDDVDDELRQKAKQLCYGIIYGMGTKTLSEQLDVQESDAVEFMETFHRCYPSIKTFINTTISNCRKNGFVETIRGRRRYLPQINSPKLSERGHAERQSVNTQIQGTAADIVKSAMISIDVKLKEMDVHNIHLVLHLHDELIYEVPEERRNSFERLLRICMEQDMKLSVPLPVKIKYGKTWGTLK